jgi:colanic acid/amylovoran biosynthesis glycosyltransferase
MKVAFATYDAPGDVGGVSVWMQRLLPLLKSAGIDVEVHLMAFGGHPGANCAKFEELGIPVRWIPWQQHLPYAVRGFLKFLEEGQPDVYVPNCIVPSYFAAGYARRSGIPTVGILHSDDSFYWGLVDEAIKGRPEFRLSAVVPVSTFLESEVSSIAAKNGIAVCRIGCGVPVSDKATEPPVSIFRLVYVGRLIEEQKRISDVAIALCGVVRRNPKLQAWIVGDGPARDTVEGIVQQSGLGARVRLLGRLDSAQIYGVLAQCHGLVLLSDYEGLSVSMLEGMAAGVVPICLDIRSGIREALQHGVNGLIVKDRAEDFFSSVEELQSDPTWWKKLSIAARETIRERYSIENCAHQWVDLLQRLDRARPARIRFTAPRVLRLPPPNPKFGQYDTRLPWQRRLKDHIRSVPAIDRVIKSMIALRTEAKRG